MEEQLYDAGTNTLQYSYQAADVSHIIGSLRVDIAREGYVYDFWREIVGMCMDEEIAVVNNEDDEYDLLLTRIMNEFILVIFQDYIWRMGNIDDSDETVAHIVNTIRGMLSYNYGVSAFDNKSVVEHKVIEFIYKYLKLLIGVPILYPESNFVYTRFRPSLELETIGSRYYLVYRVKPQGSENDRIIRSENYLQYSNVY